MSTNNMVESTLDLAKREQAALKVSEQAIENIRKAKDGQRTRTYNHVSIERTGGAMISLPTDMAYDDAIDWLERQKQAEQRVVEFTREYDAYPLDGAHATKLALERIYGFADITGRASFFGNEPPKKLELELGYGQTVVVPWGNITPVGLDGTISMSYDTEPKMVFKLHCRVRAKDEEAMRAVTEVVGHILANESIYRGRAFKLNFNWRDLEDANPLQMQPTMMTLDTITLDDLIVDDHVQAALETDLMLRLRMPEACRQAGVPLKQGILLAGPYGTGKTLAAKVAANEAVANGWTFIYLEHAKDFSETVQLASHYGPAVIFVEDIDSVASSERNEHFNAILNTIDGIDTKHHPIVTVLTTNHAERIQKSFLRAGRIDSLIEFGAPGRDQRFEFLDLYLGNLLNSDEPVDEAIDLMDGMVPAFIAEICRKATMRAMYRLGRAPVYGEVGADDLLMATKAMRVHAEKADEYGLIEQAKTRV